MTYAIGIAMIVASAVGPGRAFAKHQKNGDRRKAEFWHWVFVFTFVASVGVSFFGLYAMLKEPAQ